MKLSIIVPVYNERTVVERSLMQVLSAPLPENMEREIIVVDDCSTDGTSEILDRLRARHPEIKLLRHPVNRGKGAAIRTALAHVSGDFTLIQDADLEYDPTEYPKLLRPLIQGHADAVFGSRYLAGEQTRVLPFWHSLINQVLTLIFDMFANLKLTDMETCYKVFRTDLLKSIPIRSDRFGFEPEVAMKSAKRRWRIYEVPISYHGRTYEEGKKIRWKDGFQALATIVKFWLIDDLYVEPYGRGVLNNLTGTPQYVRWITELVRDYVGDKTFEVGAGLGTLSARLMSRSMRYVAGEKDPLYLHALQNRFLRTPNVEAIRFDPESREDYDRLESDFDTVLCLNMLEYVARPEEVLERLASKLRPGGRLVALVPCRARLFSSLDVNMGHRRRFERDDLLAMARAAGLQPVRVMDFNKAAVPPWWLHGKLLRRKRIHKVILKAFDKTVWIWRRIDRWLPWTGLSLLVVLERPGAQRAPSHPARCPGSEESLD